MKPWKQTGLGRGMLMPSLIILILTGFCFAINSTLESTTKLKKLHKSTRLRCKSCHHKPKLNAPVNIEPTPANKKCYECHTCGERRVNTMRAIPERLQDLHRYCSECHRKNKIPRTRERLKVHLKVSSHCMICHK